jgi:hypothetical protein
MMRRNQWIALAAGFAAAMLIAVQWRDIERYRRILIM